LTGYSDFEFITLKVKCRLNQLNGRSLGLFGYFTPPPPPSCEKFDVFLVFGNLMAKSGNQKITTVISINALCLWVFSFFISFLMCWH